MKDVLSTYHLEELKLKSAATAAHDRRFAFVVKMQSQDDGVFRHIAFVCA